MRQSRFYSVLLTGLILFVAITLRAQYNYSDALSKGIMFFDANKCGNDVALNNVFSWRSACHTSDGSAVSLNLTGGFHDAGDHVKFGLPQCWSAATLGFALYEFKESFDNAGSTTKLLSTLKYFTDYFLKCHPNSTTFYYQVGDGNADHGYWGSPELQTGSRPVIVATPSAPASDVCGEAAAALALMSINYKSTDATYAGRCLTAAQEIFNLGKNYLGRSSDGGGGNFYKSTSHFDDLAWGAIWLSIATNDNSYLTPVDNWINQKNDGGDDPYNKHWAPAWDDVTLFVLLKMYELTGTQKYYDGIVNNMVWYSTSLKKTSYGLPWLDSWGVLRYASAEAGLGYLAAKKFQYADYLKTADLSMNYICGSNPRNSSYITGWGNNPPVHPHHRANEPTQGGPTKGLIGGLVGGPDMSDAYSDVVGNYQQTEVAIDYNAAFLLGMAGKVYFTLHTPPKPNVPPTVSLTSPSASGSYTQGTAITLSANAADSDGSITKVEFYVSGAKVGEDSIAPYSISWVPQISGSFSITARAIDNRKGSTTSTAVAINVTNNLPTPTTPNLALNKTATSSSDENSGLTAYYAVDGSYGSRWGSAFSEPQWLQVDLGSAQTINRVILYWEAAYATVYNIQISTNGSTWTTVASIVGGNGSTDDISLANVSARYVRMYGITRVTPYGFSIYEFEVYGPGTTVPVTGVTISPATAAVNIGATTPLTATISPSNATNQSVTWSSSNTSIATVSSSGIITGVAAGSATITATTADGGFKATCVVTVTTVPVTGVTVSPTTATVNLNGTLQLTATVVPSNATNKNITWSSNNTAVATVSSSGVVTGVAVGSANITVTTADGSFTATCAVNVNNTTVPVTGVTVSPTTATVNVGGTTQLTATVAPSNATNKTVSWSSSSTSIATVSSTGLVTGVAAGSATITVTTDDGGFTATCVVNVSSSSCTFGTPLAAALSTISGSYNKVYILGSGGPNLSNVTNFTINWNLPNNGLYQLSFNTSNGVPTWWLDLRTKATWKLNQAQPEVTFSGSGFTGLDGAYWVALDGSNFVMVSKAGGFTIYFSNSSSAPVCTKSAEVSTGWNNPETNPDVVGVYPNPTYDGNITIKLSNAKPSDISLIFFNQMGQIVLQKSLGKYEAGMHEIRVQTKLSTGVYFIELKAGNSIKHLKLESL